MADGAGKGSAVEGGAAGRSAAQRIHVEGEVALCLCDRVSLGAMPLAALAALRTCCQGTPW